MIATARVRDLGRRLLAEERVFFAVAAFALAALALFPLLGRFGLWDPQEITIAEQARRVMGPAHGWTELYKTQPPLTLWLIHAASVYLGPTELAVRLPFAVLGLIAVMATYALGAHLRRPRVGFFAALVMVGSPLVLFQSRQLMTDIGTLTGASVAMLGLARLAWPRGGRLHPLRAVRDAGYTLFGLGLGFLGGGMVIGVLIPLLAMAIAQVAKVSGGFRADDGQAPTAARGTAFTVVIVAAALAALLLPLREIVHYTGGKITIDRAYHPLLGGSWRVGDVGSSPGFDAVINQVAFGMFPWSALAPLAVLRLLWIKRRDRAAWHGLLLATWALVAYAVCTIFARKVADVRYPALGAIALAVAVFFDDLFTVKVEGREAAAESTATAVAGGFPTAAVLVLLTGFCLALDTRWFPSELAAVHLGGRNVQVPTEVRLLPIVVGFGWGFTGATATGLYIGADYPRWLSAERRRAAVKWALRGGLGLGYLFGVFLALVYTPGLSQHFSYKNLFQSYFDHRRGAEPLGVMSIPGAGAEYYARGKFQRLDTVPQLLGFLRQDERVFAIVPTDRRCSIQLEATEAGTRFHVLDDQNARFLLLTNRLEGKETDRNPLAAMFQREPPQHLDHPVTANYEDTFELLGADMPARVTKGSTFQMTLWFRVKKRPTQNYKIFVHFDGGGVRFQGDHLLDATDRCPTTSWPVNSVIRDTFPVQAGRLTYPKGTYIGYVGFFTGGGGVWKNMQVLTPDHDSDNRVPVGTVVVD
jgi:4-amino-4-deoxy-L-arabinose transferase-like glycosyltransferase